MNCSRTQAHMLGARRGRLPEEQTGAVRAHLRECEECRSADAADVELTGALARLARHPAPESLRRRVEARWAPRERRWPRRAVPIAAAASLAVGVAAGALLVPRGGGRTEPAAEARADVMLNEAVNDHLRILYGEHLVEIESGGAHQVKPWFAGRVDFAPVLAFGGDADFPLKGGSVAFFMDRKAAAFVFGRRLHVITAFVFRADGLPWLQAGGETIEGHRVFVRTSRGFHTAMWRDGDLGYALVSDVMESDVRELARRLGGGK